MMEWINLPCNFENAFQNSLRNSFKSKHVKNHKYNISREMWREWGYNEDEYDTMDVLLAKEVIYKHVWIEHSLGLFQDKTSSKLLDLCLLLGVHITFDITENAIQDCFEYELPEFSSWQDLTRYANMISDENLLYSLCAEALFYFEEIHHMIGMSDNYHNHKQRMANYD